ncbi:CHC2 zinc finger family protein [Burkholderia gladioli]|uniref:CHC2 zinc finger family protein n=1 Tax=Burkholderia gladioli TaxID=28095 RepID=A0AAW3F886_BURGA|nr:CHC2 zinc finger domain-containing protein [Burkholderia gladioli]AJX01083.1 CHC2 zinc finger family protein [Burkholderia gladioli]ASD80495.1 hypothetical protein CEJ98_16930 [Burkholderia gladioli pv. gladioli]AWY54268.1 hypothetical protein A8H28_24195 [Burkholderia gladioli pv. gladioli]KGC17538.1 CHC2 zinc finger family protein [Burkholderia gladioli]SPU83318.1 DNA primase [Burkholderia gladioli]
MNWYDLDEVLSKAELPEVARRLGMDVEKIGANLVTLCPFHEDTRPSLVLYPRDSGSPSHYHCFSCNAHGYAVDLVKRVQGAEFKPAIEWLARSMGIAPKRTANARPDAERSTRDDALAFANRVFDQQHDEAGFVDWCRDRRFDRDFLYSLGLRCLPVSSILVRALKSESLGRQQELIDGLLTSGLLVRLRPEIKTNSQTSLNLSEQFRDYFHDGRVLIPIRSATNELIGFAGRHRPQSRLNNMAAHMVAKYLLTPGFSKGEVLFNAHQARQAMRATVQAGQSHPVLYVAEGFLDALRLQSLNLPAVAVMGSSLSEKQREGLVTLLEAANPPGGMHLSLRLFFDRDGPGFDGANRACRQLLGLPGVATEWIGFGDGDNMLTGKDPDEILNSFDRDEAIAMLDQHALPAVGILVAAGIGYKDATPLLSNELWNGISRYPRERALLQAVRAVRALSGAVADWAQRLGALAEPRPQWVADLLALLRPQQPAGHAARQPIELTFLVEQEARFNHARMLAEHGSRRGELPCDDETWRVLDRNAQLFNILAEDRLKQPAWRPAALCDAVHLPRKLSGDDKVLGDPRCKVMPHPADLHLQQFLMNELLTERHDFSHEGPRSFSDCIPAVRWFASEGEVRLTGYVGERELSPALRDDERGPYEEPVLSFAYQIDMDVLEGRRKPSDQGMFRPYIECWRGYMASLGRQARAIGPHVHVLRLDAKRYYDSIQRYVVRDRLQAPVEQALTISGAKDISKLLDLPAHDAKDAAKHLVDLLCGSLFEHRYRHPDDGSEHSSAEVIGIPQGPVISAWIGTIAMFPLDAAARSFMRQPDQRHPNDPERPRVGYARYVDDIVLLADSETRLNAMREAVQNAASHLALTLVRKGEAVAPGSPEWVMQQLNNGRALAPSVPAWEPPLVGDGETGWGMGTDDVGSMDRQSALHLLRHPNLLDDPVTVHEKVRDAMRAPDLRPSDLGKCARALWWQVAMQSIEHPEVPNVDAWKVIWNAYRQRWENVCAGHAWASGFHRQGYDILFAIEGLDMLMDSGPSMQKGRTQEWIDLHRKALDALAKTILEKDDLLQGITLTRNRTHIQNRARKVQWKALQRVPNIKPKLHVDSQKSINPTLTDWLCLAAILLNRYDANVEPKSHPLDLLPIDFNPMESDGPREIRIACAYIRPPAANREMMVGSLDAEGSRIALQFLVANTAGPPRFSRWDVLKLYRELIGNGLDSSQEIAVLPPLPVADAGMLGYIPNMDTSDIRLFAFTSQPDAKLATRLVGATLTDAHAHSVPSMVLSWQGPVDLAHGLHRFQGEQPIRLVFDTLHPANRARFAADLYEVLHVIQRQDAGAGNEWVIVMAHLAHEPTADMTPAVNEVSACKWYLVSSPVASDHLGVSAWVRDGRGGLRSVSVPGGEYTKLWRLGCAVSDALNMAFDLSNEVSASDEDDALAHPHQIEEYVLRQQLSKLRGTWIADAQVQDKVGDGLPATVQRSLDILRRFDPSLDASEQVKVVLHTEAETRSMAMRLQRKGPSDLRDRLHLLPTLVLQRMPLSVLEWLPLQHDRASTSLRTDLALLLALADSLDGDYLDVRTDGPQDGTALGPGQALHIGVALAATGVALRGLVASAWGIARYRSPLSLPERLPIPVGWNLPDASRQNPQRDYDTVRNGLCDDDWAGLKEVTPWQWMLALLGILDSVAPQVLDASGDNPLGSVYEHLRKWQSASPEKVENRQWTWPYDDMPAYDADAWRSLLNVLASAIQQVDQYLGLVIRQVEAPSFRRHRDDNGFTDAESQQWTLTKLQYTGLGSADSVARMHRGNRRLATWTEVRRRADDELLSIHTLDDKLGRWWHNSPSPVPREVPPVQVIESPTAAPSMQKDGMGDSTAKTSDGGTQQDRAEDLRAPASNVDAIRKMVRESQRASWVERGKVKSPSHMRVALLQWRVDESYSHPLAEVGLLGMGMPERGRENLRKALVAQSSMAMADNAAVRGREHTWPTTAPESVPSWPEHRRRRLLKRALDACHLLNVELLVLPEVSVRRETVDWLEHELRRQYPGLAVLAGTYRHFGQSVGDRGDAAPAGGDVHHLMAPLTMLWRPDEKMSKALFTGLRNPPDTLRFWRGKKYRSVAANELFRPDWRTLQPLFRIDQLLDQLGELDLPSERQKELLRTVAEEMPSLRYCMELICSELFLLTSPANIAPLQKEMDAMMSRFPGGLGQNALEIVSEDFTAVGKALSVLQENRTSRRTVLLVPAATSRSNDYWHAGQASVLASGTATVFCNAAKSNIACGGSCFIGIDSATNRHGNYAGLIETLTPYHGWRRGILTARADGALSDADQALVVADIDPVHVVSGKPRPQLLPEPVVLVAYLPIVELLDSDVNKVNLHRVLVEDGPPQIDGAANANDVQAALAQVATASHPRKRVESLWKAFDDLRNSASSDGVELDNFAKLFADDKSVRERLRAWARDRHQQPHAAYGPLNLEPAWLDFLDVDLTLREGQSFPSIAVPPWHRDAASHSDVD